MMKGELKNMNKKYIGILIIVLIVVTSLFVLRDNFAITGNAILVGEGDSQVIKMDVTRSGWQPNSFVLKKGVPVRWEINAKELTGCNNQIIVDDYDLDIKLKKGLNVVEFIPDKTGTVGWSCWMGMIPGSFIVTDDGTASDAQVKPARTAARSPGVSCGASSGGGCGCGG